MLAMGAGFNQSGDALKAPEISTPDRHPRTATVAPRAMGGAPCLCQFQIRVQILPLKHVTSRQLLDGTSESLGSTASGTIFQASSRSGKRSAGLKTKPRPGCRLTAKRPSLILRSRDRIEPALATARSCLTHFGRDVPHRCAFTRVAVAKRRQLDRSRRLS